MSQVHCGPVARKRSLSHIFEDQSRNVSVKKKKHKAAKRSKKKSSCNNNLVQARRQKVEEQGLSLVAIRFSREQKGKAKHRRY